MASEVCHASASPVLRALIGCGSGIGATHARTQTVEYPHPGGAAFVAVADAVPMKLHANAAILVVWMLSGPDGPTTVAVCGARIFVLMLLKLRPDRHSTFLRVQVMRLR